tara:strand:- start:1302 stop:1808 length:507 start_codon:yes stop_codon:yes gene_type:complete
MKRYLLSAWGCLILTASGCSVDEPANLNTPLTGVWFKTVDYADEDQTRTTEWSFLEDGTLEIVYMEFEKSSGDFLGFSVLYKGDYSMGNNTLHMTNMVGYSYSFDGATYIEDATFLPNKESFFSRQGGKPYSNSASVRFRKNSKELVLTYLECNDVADCVGSETLYKK